MSIQTLELPCRSGRLGMITLDSPQTLNALSADMLQRIQATLDLWRQDEQVCLVLLNANGDSGFSAGADLREIYKVLDDPSDAASTSGIFAREYRVDYSLHTFPKPVVCLAPGICMGGGMGLLQASRYRLITPDTVLSMPEARIGLFPDAGASWFLNRLPGRIGLFMGLTGARLNASDATRIGLADRVIARPAQDQLIRWITDQYWSGNIAADDNRLFRLLNQLEEPAPDTLPASELARYEQDIARLCRRDDLPRVVERLLNSDPGNDWWTACIDNLKAACPVSLWLLDRQLTHGLQMPLNDIFRMELALAVNCSTRPDFREGIRAMMIDKDQHPKWSSHSVTEVSQAYVESHFDLPWPAGQHPLADL